MLQHRIYVELCNRFVCFFYQNRYLTTFLLVNVALNALLIKTLKLHNSFVFDEFIRKLALLRLFR